MLQQKYHGPFKKEYKLMIKRGKDINKLNEIMNMIVNEEPLPPRCQNHPLHGNYKSWWDCHIEGDWVLIYKVKKDTREAIFYRTGTHSDLGI